MVYTNAYRRMVLTADIEEGYETFFETLEFGGIFLVGIFKMLE